MSALTSVIEDCVRIARSADSHESTSDLHVEAGAAPWLRVAGELQPTSLAPVGDVEIRAFCEAYLAKHEYERLNGIGGAADGALSHPELGAIRLHAFRTDKGIGLSLRLLRRNVPSLGSLGLPAAVAGLADLPHGLVLFTGPTGCGKSTALAALIDEINAKHARHILTVEDPIEYRHLNKRSLVRQREIGRDVATYADSLRGLLRADPDVIALGELRDPEVMAACLQAGETGHLVLSTLHTTEASETVGRIVGAFEGMRQDHVRLQLAQSLRAIVSLRLLADASGNGRHAACEVLINTPAIRSQLASPERTLQIRNTIEISRKDGMQTLEMDLNRLIAERLITFEAATAVSEYPGQLRDRGTAR